MNTSFEIDGRAVEAQPFETLIEAAARVGIALPHLCHKEGLECAWMAVLSGYENYHSKNHSSFDFRRGPGLPSGTACGGPDEGAVEQCLPGCTWE